MIILGSSNRNVYLLLLFGKHYLLNDVIQSELALDDICTKADYCIHQDKVCIISPLCFMGPVKFMSKSFQDSGAKEVPCTRTPGNGDDRNEYVDDHICTPIS